MVESRKPKGILPYSPTDYPENVPEFTSEEEMREFWDTHDVSYYWDQFEDVTDSPPAGLAEGPTAEEASARNLPRRENTRFVSVRLSTDEIDEVKAVAERQSVPYLALLRSWVGERLAQETSGQFERERKAS